MPKVTVTADNAHVSKRDDKYILEISSRTGQFEFEFAAETWTKLGETAAWFQKKAAQGEL